MVSNVLNPRTLKIKTRGSGVQGQRQLQSQFKARVDYKRPEAMPQETTESITFWKGVYQITILSQLLFYRLKINC